MCRSHWITLAVAGIMLGCLLTVHPLSRAALPEPTTDPAINSQEETINQLKEINAQLKDLSALLRSGAVKVTVVINPDAQPE